MKRVLLLIVALGALCARGSQGYAAPLKLDPTLVPFKKGELQQKLQSNTGNAHALILLLLRADEMSSSRVDPSFTQPNPKSYNLQALKTLEQLRQRYPDNVNVLAAYCFALDIPIQGMHRQFVNYPQKSPEREEKFKSVLKELREKAPKLWVPYAIEGYRRFYFGGKSSAGFKQGLQLLERAIELGPTVPLIRVRYARVCRYAADWEQADPEIKAKLYSVGVSQCEKALQLQPPSSEAALSLARCYIYGWTQSLTKDKAKARVAAQRFLSMMPPGYVFADYEKRVLSRADIKVP